MGRGLNQQIFYSMNVLTHKTKERSAFTVNPQGKLINK